MNLSFRYLEDRASETAARVTAAPDTCTGSSDSPSQAQAIAIASTGSSMAVIPARVALIRWRAATTSAKGTIVPSTTIQAISAQTGTCLEARLPSSETRSWTRPPGKFHHGASTDQKRVAKRKPHADSE